MAWRSGRWATARDSYLTPVASVSGATRNSYCTTRFPVELSWPVHYFLLRFSPISSVPLFFLYVRFFPDAARLSLVAPSDSGASHSDATMRGLLFLRRNPWRMKVRVFSLFSPLAPWIRVRVRRFCEARVRVLRVLWSVRLMFSDPSVSTTEIFPMKLYQFLGFLWSAYRRSLYFFFGSNGSYLEVP